MKTPYQSSGKTRNEFNRIINENVATIKLCIIKIVCIYVAMCMYMYLFVWLAKTKIYKHKISTEIVQA